MYNMHQDDSDREVKEKPTQCRHEQPSTSIDIPLNKKDLFYNQMSPQYQEFYSDILSFTSDSSLLDAYPLNHSSIHSNPSSAQDHEDPMNDPQFMAFLSSLSTSEPTSSPSLSTMMAPLDIGASAQAENDESNDMKAKKADTSKRIKKRTHKSNTRLGQCEHPKHGLYRQEKYILTTHGTVPADETSSSVSIQSIPRRGRPPKGSKSTEFVYSTSPLSASADDPVVMESPSTAAAAAAAAPYYPIVELTVRPLPKRLEAVVGKTNIKVCLTCLKRSDMDPAYLKNASYIGPQILKRRK